jgi:hypothetical protein
MIFLEFMVRMRQERPTSHPAPKGKIDTFCINYIRNSSSATIQTDKFHKIRTYLKGRAEGVEDERAKIHLVGLIKTK